MSSSRGGPLIRTRLTGSLQIHTWPWAGTGTGCCCGPLTNTIRPFIKEMFLSNILSILEAGSARGSIKESPLSAITGSGRSGKWHYRLNSFPFFTLWAPPKPDDPWLLSPRKIPPLPQPNNPNNYSKLNGKSWRGFFNIMDGLCPASVQANIIPKELFHDCRYQL